MDSISRRAAAPAAGGRSPLPAIAARLRAFGHELAGCWRSAIARRQLDDLDAAALRDLGMHRSELGSYRAELDGRVEPTRRRVRDAFAARPGG